ALQGTNGGLSVPYSFRAITEAKGDLQVEVDDENTFYAQGSPKVQGATITLFDPTDGHQVAQATTDATGVVTLAGVMAGQYALQVAAPHHGTYHGAVTIVPGVTNTATAFIAQQVVTYS